MSASVAARTATKRKARLLLLPHRQRQRRGFFSDSYEQDEMETHRDSQSYHYYPFRHGPINTYQNDKQLQRNLIMEILQAQPSLRDSKTYLNSFAPRKLPIPKRTKPAPTSAKPSHPEFPIPQGVQHPGSLHNPSTTTWDPEKTIPLEADTENQFRNAPPPPSPSSATSILEHIRNQHPLTLDPNPQLTPASTSLADQITPDPSSDSLADSHTALVKVQGPFTDRQLDSIAEGLVYLKKLGLVSVCVVDSDDWPQFTAEIDQNGKYLLPSDEIEQQRLEQWLPSSSQDKGKGKQKAQTSRFSTGLGPSCLGRRQERLRRQIMAETQRLAESLNRKGAMARPVPQPVVRVDAAATTQAESEFRDLAGPSSHKSSSSSSSFVDEERRLRPPLVTDDALASIRSALAADEIPVISPYALFENKIQGTLETLCVRADDVMVALTRDMVVSATKADAERTHDNDDDGTSFAGGEVDMMPLRLMVINREGGIPSHARSGDPHLSINLASEYHQIRNSFIWSRSHPTALRNLDAISDCLGYMPRTSSGVLVTHRSPRSLIANLITNKAAHSPSLPHRLLANKKDVRHTPTIVRPGLPIKVLEDFSLVDRDKLTALLEASFRRKLDREAYFARLASKLDFVIVTGDYEGAAIVTREHAPSDPEGAEPIAYLDKFAVLPSLQGSGTVDFLWGALRDEVQGLGLLDALNDNGGKGGYGRGRDLVWKSRSNNPVNRWYYERSNGFTRIGGGAWQLFWCDAEDRLASLSGESRLMASPSHLERARDEVDAAYERARLYSRPRAAPLLRNADLTILPIVAQEEEGRLTRWAECMKTIPTAWAD